MSPPYSRAAHYFGDAGIGNFWTTFDPRQVDSDFARIRADGFDTIILVLPWAAFQPRLDPVSYSAGHLDRLRWLIGRAGASDLRVVLRLGYLWERDRLAVRTPERYRTMLRRRTREGREMEAAWADYHRRIAVEAEGVDFVFLCWEDPYWPALRGPTERDDETRLKVARASGFLEHTGIESIPRVDEPEYEHWLRFFDHVLLNRITELAAPAWERIEMRFEHRIDGDPYTDAAGVTHRYEYSVDRPGVRGDLVYYHPNLGDVDKRARDASAALAHLDEILDYCDRQGLERPFVDQFNFTLNNPEFTHFSSIHDEDLPDLIRGSAPLFRRHTSGYGLWGLRDWIDDKISNGRFGFGSAHWSMTGCRHGASGLSVQAGSRLEQSLSGILLPDSVLELRISQVDEPLAVEARVDAGAGARTATLTIAEPGVRTLEFVPAAEPALRIDVRAGAGRIERVALYSHTFTNGCYRRDWSERPAVAALRSLNRELSAEQMHTGRPG